MQRLRRLGMSRGRGFVLIDISGVGGGFLAILGIPEIDTLIYFKLSGQIRHDAMKFGP
jgi:hypothetical protein